MAEDDHLPPAVAELRKLVADNGGAGEAAAWDALWGRKLTAWDLGEPTAALLAEARKCGAPPGSRWLVPGCGSGWDVAALAALGFVAVGLDVSELAAAAARETVEGNDGASVLCADFFDADLGGGAFDYIFDYTFFCALPPALRAKWGARTAELLAPGGRLLTLAFPLGSDEEAADPNVAGPPFTVSVDQYTKALAPHGVVMVGEPRSSEHSVAPRAPREKVVWWEKPL